MLMVYLVYMLVVVLSSGVRQLYRVRVLGRAPRAKQSFVTQTNGGAAADGGSSALSESGLQPLSAAELHECPVCRAPAEKWIKVHLA